MAASVAAAQQRQQQHHKEAELDDAAEVVRVLASKSHLECLRLRAGASRADVKGKYHELARLLHPDKCKVCCGVKGLCRFLPSLVLIGPWIPRRPP